MDSVPELRNSVGYGVRLLSKWCYTVLYISLYFTSGLAVHTLQNV